MFPDCSPGVEGPLVDSAAERRRIEGPLVGKVRQGDEQPVEAHAVTSPASTGRGATIGRLTAELGAFAEAGDLEAARIVHEAIGRLMCPVPVRGEDATVVDLDAERQRRAGR